MGVLRIRGGLPLQGTLKVQGAKNSVLPIMAASILACGETVIHNCPNLSDVEATIKILRHLGCTVEREDNSVYIDSASMMRCDIPHDLMREMRSSVIFLGAILARTGEAMLSLPGGCELGPRPIDIHLMALRAMGAEITENGGNIICKAHRLKGCRINLPMPSVGATENSILAATRCEGVTTITNAAREPEITDLQDYLNKLGTNVIGAGTPTVTVEGKCRSCCTEHRVIPDRIVAATYLSAAASAGGRVVLTGVIPDHLKSVTNVLSEMGCSVRCSEDEIEIASEGVLKASRPIITEPYPGFPTDAQPPIMAAALRAEGTTVFIENIFQNRYRHVSELLRMGADIKMEGRVAMTTGVKHLMGAPVTATDLRGAAALAVAALGAQGTTEISGLGHLDRGYENFEQSLRLLGADVIRTV